MDNASIKSAAAAQYQSANAANLATQCLVYSDAPQLVTLGTVAVRQAVVGKSVADLERKLAAALEHITGRPQSHGDPKCSSQKEPNGIAGQMHDQACSAAETAERADCLLNSLMTHLGMNEPASIARQG